VPGVSFQRFLWSLAALAVLTIYAIRMDGDSGAGEPPSAVALAARLGCTAAPKPTHRGVREIVACADAGDGYGVTVATFEDNVQRNAWVDEERTLVVVSGLSGTPRALVAGDRWAAETGDAAAVEQLRTLANGWSV
jgi:hypothetical protein